MNEYNSIKKYVYSHTGSIVPYVQFMVRIDVHMTIYVQKYSAHNRVGTVLIFQLSSMSWMSKKPLKQQF